MLGHVRSSVSARNDILMCCFFSFFLARLIGWSLEPTTFFFPFLSCIAYEQTLHLGESREVTREPHAKGDASVRGGELQSRAWSFACLGRFVRRTKKKRETARSLGKERRALLFLRHSRALSPLEVESLLAGYLNQYSSVSSEV